MRKLAVLSMIIARSHQGCPSPPTGYGVVHSYGPMANTSFTQRPLPPQPMPRTCPRQGTSTTSGMHSHLSVVKGVNIRTKGIIYLLPHLRARTTHIHPKLGITIHPQLTSTHRNLVAQSTIYPHKVSFYLLVTEYHQLTMITVTNTHHLWTQSRDASHMGRYSPSQNNSSPDSTEVRSSPLSHDHYSRFT